jgi:hypothetical protein
MTVPQGLPPLSRVSAFDFQQPHYGYEPNAMAMQLSNYAERQCSSSSDSSSASSSSYGRGSPDPASSASSRVRPVCASNAAHRPLLHAHEPYLASLAVPRLPSPLSTGYALVATCHHRHAVGLRRSRHCCPTGVDARHPLRKQGSPQESGGAHCVHVPTQWLHRDIYARIQLEQCVESARICSRSADTSQATSTLIME